MKKIILVDNTYYARAIKHARRTAKIPRYCLAKYLGISKEQLAKIENGKILAPDSIMEKVLYHGLLMLAARSLVKKNT